MGMTWLLMWLNVYITTLNTMLQLFVLYYIDILIDGMDVIYSG